MTRTHIFKPEIFVFAATFQEFLFVIFATFASVWRYVQRCCPWSWCSELTADRRQRLRSGRRCCGRRRTVRAGFVETPQTTGRHDVWWSSRIAVEDDCE